MIQLAAWELKWHFVKVTLFPLYVCTIYLHIYFNFYIYFVLKHLKVIANEGELNNGDVDVQDWNSLRKMQV